DLADLVAELLAKNPAKRPEDAAAEYRRLVPHVSGAHPLQHMADQEVTPLRMYADVLTRVLHLPGSSRAEGGVTRASTAEMSQARWGAMALDRAGLHRG